MLMVAGSQHNNLPNYPFSTRWAALAYVALAIFQTFTIMLNKKPTVFKNITLVNLLFLPHAGNIIATWMIGSHAIFLLIAAPSLIDFMLIPNFIKFTQADFGRVVIHWFSLDY